MEDHEIMELPVMVVAVTLGLVDKLVLDQTLVQTKVVAEVEVVVTPEVLNGQVVMVVPVLLL